MRTHPKILSLDELAAKSRALRAAGRQLVFTNGCFDVLHVGHVRYLGAARREGDALAVGLNSDASVLRIKGPRRPIVPEGCRPAMAEAIARANYGMRLGKFELDFQVGELRHQVGAVLAIHCPPFRRPLPVAP